MLISKNYQQLLDTKGVPMNRLGINEVGLTRGDTLHAIAQLQKDSIPILGGDVYFRQDSGIEPAYANWYSDPIPGDEPAEFLARSWTMALRYVQDFPSREDVEPIFVLAVGQ
jgi:hypothetical protein